MQKKLLFTTLLISIFIHAEENNLNNTILITQYITEINQTTFDRNSSNEENLNDSNKTILEQGVFLIQRATRKFSEKQLKPIIKNFNMAKGESYKGEKIFIKELKKRCQTTAYKFTNLHDQEEWEAIAESGNFREILFDFCPEIKESYQNEWSPDLYQFAYQHANDI